MYQTVVLTQLASTLPLVGLIWFVQIVHYPLFSLVGRAEFPAYHRGHVRRTTAVVAGLMIVELLSAAMLPLVAPHARLAALAWSGLLLVLAIWISTGVWQVPLHDRLAPGMDSRRVNRLVLSNWLRTAAWTLRGLLVLYLAQPGGREA